MLGDYRAFVTEGSVLQFSMVILDGTCGEFVSDFVSFHRRAYYVHNLFND